jgi:hypothetical protein
MIIGYIRTKRYVPDMEAAWNNVENLPIQISFGAKITPAFYFLTLFIVALLCGLIIFLSKRIFV